MAYLTPNTFSSWELTDEEAVQGGIYTDAQLQVLQNLLAVNAEEKLSLAFDPTQPELFVREEAYKRGQIELIQHLIATSDANKELLKSIQNLSNN